MCDLSRAVRVLVLLFALCPGVWSQELAVAKVGDRVPGFAFQKIAVVDDGSSRLEQWLGQPILFEFWGTR